MRGHAVAGAEDVSFYDFDEYERLVLTASALDASAHLIVLLGGDPSSRAVGADEEWLVADLQPEVLHGAEDRAGCVVCLDPAHQPLAIVTTERLYGRTRASTDWE